MLLVFVYVIMDIAYGINSVQYYYSLMVNHIIIL